MQCTKLLMKCKLFIEESQGYVFLGEIGTKKCTKILTGVFLELRIYMDFKFSDYPLIFVGKADYAALSHEKACLCN